MNDGCLSCISVENHLHGSFSREPAPLFANSPSATSSRSVHQATAPKSRIECELSPLSYETTDFGLLCCLLLLKVILGVLDCIFETRSFLCQCVSLARRDTDTSFLRIDLVDPWLELFLLDLNLIMEHLRLVCCNAECHPGYMDGRLYDVPFRLSRMLSRTSSSFFKFVSCSSISARFRSILAVLSSMVRSAVALACSSCWSSWAVP